ncbi:MAG: hypothetical protein ACRCZS_19115 [Chroococcidiopsis sp.]
MPIVAPKKSTAGTAADLTPLTDRLALVEATGTTLSNRITTLSSSVDDRLDILEAKEIPDVSQFSRVPDPKWLNTGDAPPMRYDRKVKRSAMTSLKLDYKTKTGVIKSFSAIDFITGVYFSGFWGADVKVFDVGNEAIQVIFGADTITFAAMDTAADEFLQIRSVFVNGLPLDVLSVYQPDFSTKVVDTKWRNTAVVFVDRFYKSCNRATMTSLSFEYRKVDGTIGTFSATSFTTDFVYSSTWNTGSDPNGATKSYQQGESIILSFNGAGDRLCIAVFQSGSLLPVRKVAINGTLDYLTTYDPSSY